MCERNFQDLLKEHFSTFGTVASVNFEKDDVGDGSLFASVNFENRLDAERVRMLVVLSRFLCALSHL